MGWELGVEDTPESAQLQRTEDLIQIVLAAVVPALLAAMLFSYLLFEALFPVLFLAAILVAVLMLIPANRLHNLHFRTWCVNSLPTKLITSIVGMIYISVVAIFAVGLLSVYQGLDPENPTTFAIVGGLLLLLMVIMSYRAQNKQRFLSTHKRFFPKHHQDLANGLVSALEKNGLKHERKAAPKGASIDLPEHGLRVKILPLRQKSSEVLLENITETNLSMAVLLKGYLEAI